MEIDVQDIGEANQGDSIKAHETFIEQLQADALFNRYFPDWYSLHLRGTAEPKPHPDGADPIQITADSLASHVARFYYANNYYGEKIQYTLCITRNGYQNLEAGERHGHLEAFAYSVFSADLSGNQKLYQIAKNYMEAIDNEITRDMDDPVEYARHLMYEKLTSNPTFVDSTVKRLKKTLIFPLR